MRTLMWVGWTNLRRDRVAQMLTFLLPIVFFSIFATVFGGQSDATTARIRIAVVDEDHSDVSARLIQGLHNEKSLRTQSTADPSGEGTVLTRAAAEQLVRSGDVPVAIVIPAGLGTAFSTNGFAGGGPAVQLLSDVSDPIAPQYGNDGFIYVRPRRGDGNDKVVRPWCFGTPFAGPSISR